MTQIGPNLEIWRRAHYSWKLRTEKPLLSTTVSLLLPSAKYQRPIYWLDLCPATQLMQEL